MTNKKLLATTTTQEYFIAAHPVQQAILQLVANDPNARNFTLREFGECIGLEKHAPQRIKWHLQQMVRYGYLDIIAGEYRVGETLKKIPTHPSKTK